MTSSAWLCVPCWAAWVKDIGAAPNASARAMADIVLDILHLLFVPRAASTAAMEPTRVGSRPSCIAIKHHLELTLVSLGAFERNRFAQSRSGASITRAFRQA